MTRRIYGLLLTSFLVASLLPAIPSAAQSADALVVEAPDPVPVDPAPPAARPAPIQDDERVPVPSWDPEPEPQNVVPALPASDDPADKVDGAREVKSKATETASVYKVGGGEHVLDLTVGPQNYETDAGRFEKIDESLVEADGGWRNAAGPVQAFFPQTLESTTPVTLAFEDGSIAMAPADGKGTAAVDGNRATYAEVLKGVTLDYFMTATGYAEHVVLAEAPGTNSFSWLVQVEGLELRMEASGDVSLLRDDKVIGLIPRPLVSDSNIDPETGLGAETETFRFALEDRGKGAYVLSVVYDRAWLEDKDRVYPVVIDPYIEKDLPPSRDTHVRQCSPTSSYPTTTDIRAGTSGSCNGHYSFIDFDLTNYVHATRIVYYAYLDLWKLENGGGTVAVRRITQSWAGGTTTWNNQPSVSSTTYATTSGSANAWQEWDLGSLYQQILDGTLSDHGIRLGSSTYHRYASDNTTIPNAKGHLFLAYNDPPNSAVLANPTSGAVVTTQSPVLSVNAMPGDYNGDDVWIQFQISETSAFGTDVVLESPLLDSKSWAADAGVLKDGQTYWWRVKSFDVCEDANGEEGPCSNQDATGATHARPLSGVRTFQVELPHYGSDDRWAMTPFALSNGMTTAVNQSNGNLFVEYPMDAYATQAGPLALSLTYNSQMSEANGLGAGWQVMAGPASDGSKLPFKIVEESPAVGDSVRIHFSDGDRLHFGQVDDSNLYRGGRGNVRHSPGASGGETAWTYTTANGSRYTFFANGHLKQAKPSSDGYASPGFDYAFDAAGRIDTVTDPDGRVLDFAWPVGTGQTTVSWDGTPAWEINHLGGGVASVEDPEGGIVEFGYGTNTLLSWVEDGANARTNVVYDTESPPRVTSVTLPAVSGEDPFVTAFVYGPPLVSGGTIASWTEVTGPLGTLTTSNSDDHEVRTDFSNAGLPIRVYGPYVYDPAAPGPDHTIWPITRMAWDTDGQLLCSRTPAVIQAKGDGCTSADTTDTWNTEYTYGEEEPHPLLSMQGPAPDVAGTGPRALTTYAYDEGFQGLHQQLYPNEHLSGMPAHEEIAPVVWWNWGTGGPTPLAPQTNNWSARFFGLLDPIGTGERTYKFRLKADDRSRLVIDEKLVVDCWDHVGAYDTNCGEGDKTKVLDEGEPVEIFVEYADVSGDAHIELWWDKGEGVWQLIPIGHIAPNLSLLTSVTDPKGTTTYTYAGDEAKVRRLPSVKTRGARFAESTYDTYGRVTATENALGHVSTSAYDQNGDTGCLTTATGPTGAVTTFDCNAYGDVTRSTQVVRAVSGTGQTSAQDRVVDTTYDLLGRVETVSTPYLAGGSPAGYSTNTYDAAGRLKTVTDPLGNVTENFYDERGRLTRELLPDPNGPSEAPPAADVLHDYDAAGNKLSTTDARDEIWTSAFDAAGRLTQIIDPAGVVTNTAYSLIDRTGAVSVDNVAPVPDVVTTTTTDLLGRKVSESLGTFPATAFEYDVMGNVTKVSDPAGVWTQNTYNAFSEVTKTEQEQASGPTPYTTDYVYDNAGRQTSVTDPRGETTSYTYDNADRLLTASLPDSLGVFEYLYNDASERVRVEDGSDRWRNFSFDARGQLTALADARGTTAHDYDANGRLIQVDEPGARVQNFAHDNLGRRTERWGATTSTDHEVFGYDAAGNLTSATGSGITTAIAYDDAGRLLTVSQSGSTTTMAYAGSFLDSVTTVAGQTSFTYRTDSSGLLASVTTPFSASPTTYGYDASGRPETRTDPTGLVTTRSYDGAGRISRHRVMRSTTEVADFELTFDAASNVLTKDAYVEGAGSENGAWTYAYDGAGRLETAAFGGVATEYGYDGAGNRASTQVGTNPVLNTVYDSAGHPDCTTTASNCSSGVVTNYVTDDTGRITTVEGPAQDFDYSYDTWSRLASATGPSATLGFSYDGLDRTVLRTEGSDSTAYLYTGLTEDPARVTAAAVVTDYSYANGLPLAQKTAGDVRYLIRDLHTDVVGIASLDGSMAGTAAFGPWGEERATTGEDSRLGYQGDLTDPDTGLVDMLTRLYEPALGRFMTRDVLVGEPNRPLSLNQFAYGLMSPVSKNDPTGLCAAGPDVCPTTNRGGRGDASYNPSPADYPQPSQPVERPGTWDALHGRGYVPPVPLASAPVLPPSSMDEMMGALHQYSDMADETCANAPSGWQEACSDAVFMNLAALNLAGAESLDGLLPWGFPEPRYPPPDHVEGNSGWREELVDDNEMARHFVFWMAFGYFHPVADRPALRWREREGVRGGSEQDIRSGDLASDLGGMLRGDLIDRGMLLTIIPIVAGDPNNPGIDNPTSDPGWSIW